jgi:GNAT superfamily N-acetyltransferase
MNELELLKEIEDLDKKINTCKLITRNLKESDWDTLVKWWDSWPDWTAPSKDFLPDNGTGGLMVEKNGMPIVAGFIYETNSSSVLLEWIVSDPEYRDDDRGQAVELLITEAEKMTKSRGYNYMFTIGRNKRLIETHKKLGWSVDDKPSHEIIKKL